MLFRNSERKISSIFSSGQSKLWHNYQNFAQWFNENRYDVEGRLHIDKDILYPGNKIYCPDTCLLVPQRINMLFLNKPNKRGLPNGIIKSSDRYLVKYCGVEYGYENTLEEAFIVNDINIFYLLFRYPLVK